MVLSSRRHGVLDADANLKLPGLICLNTDYYQERTAHEPTELSRAAAGRHGMGHVLLIYSLLTQCHYTTSTVCFSYTTESFPSVLFPSLLLPFLPLYMEEAISHVNVISLTLLYSFHEHNIQYAPARPKTAHVED